VRLRTLSAAIAATLVVAGLAGCRTNVGTAAIVDGHRISESHVNAYITPKAQPVPLQTSSNGGTVQVAPRSYVIENLIDDQLLVALLRLTPGGIPSASDIAKITSQGLNGKSPAQVAQSAKIIGFTQSFYQLWVHNRVLGLVLSDYANRGVNVSALVKKLRFPVSVSPRYGSWDAKNLSLASGAGAGLPSFLVLQPTPAPAAAGAAN
jgi:hypothetical protein